MLARLREWFNREWKWAGMWDVELKGLDLVEQGRRLASEREDLIAAGVDPATLLIPLWPGDAD